MEEKENIKVKMGTDGGDAIDSWWDITWGGQIFF